MPMIYPVPGRRVPLPRSRAVLPKRGRLVELDTYWRRRLRDGDVTLKNPRKVSKPRTPSRAREEG